MTPIEQWIKSFSGDDSSRQIAINAGIPIPTLARQLRENSVTVETAVKIARAYQASVIPALMILEVLTESDITAFSIDAALQDATDEMLAAEVLRRLKSGSALMDAPISEVENHLNRSEDRINLAYAADSSPEELFPGDDGYGEMQ